MHKLIILKSWLNQLGYQYFYLSDTPTLCDTRTIGGHAIRSVVFILLCAAILFYYLCTYYVKFGKWNQVVCNFSPRKNYLHGSWSSKMTYGRMHIYLFICIFILDVIDQHIILCLVLTLTRFRKVWQSPFPTIAFLNFYTLHIRRLYALNFF